MNILEFEESTMLARYAVSTFSGILLLLALPAPLKANPFDALGNIDAKPMSLPELDATSGKYWWLDRGMNMWTWTDVNSGTTWYYTNSGWMTVAQLENLLQNLINNLNQLIQYYQSSGQSTQNLNNSMLTLTDLRDVMSVRWP